MRPTKNERTNGHGLTEKFLRWKDKQNERTDRNWFLTVFVKGNYTNKRAKGEMHEEKSCNIIPSVRSMPQWPTSFCWRARTEFNFRVVNNGGVDVVWLGYNLQLRARHASTTSVFYLNHCFAPLSHCETRRCMRCAHGKGIFSNHTLLRGGWAR